ncbi:MAG TPA: hypothetical protein VMB50_11200 [Myxococcales bacterium]|nr:hypothetical protein [Myxococcales bacterium]
MAFAAMRAHQLVVLLVLAGCANPAPTPDDPTAAAANSVGHIGCLASDIAVSHLQRTDQSVNLGIYVGPTYTWEATCKGHTYICAERLFGLGPASDIACSPKLP